MRLLSKIGLMAWVFIALVWIFIFLNIPFLVYLFFSCDIVSFCVYLFLKLKSEGREGEKEIREGKK